MSARIDYIDSLRGIVMLCVVYWHISIYTGTTDSPVNLIYMPFYMTLFFFLNGFFSHTIILTLSEGWEKVKKRKDSFLYYFLQ